jgi:hypothetical protein
LNLNLVLADIITIEMIEITSTMGTMFSNSGVVILNVEELVVLSVGNVKFVELSFRRESRSVELLLPALVFCAKAVFIKTSPMLLASYIPSLLEKLVIVNTRKGIKVMVKIKAKFTFFESFCNT